MQRKEKRTTQAVKTTFTFIKEKEPLCYQLPYSSTTKKKKVNGDQEGCMIYLKPSPIRIDNNVGKVTSVINKFGSVVGNM
jgi:hypothetical protein